MRSASSLGLRIKGDPMGPRSAVTVRRFGRLVGLVAMAMLAAGAWGVSGALPASGMPAEPRSEVATATSWLCGQNAEDLPWLRNTSSNAYATSVAQETLNGLGYSSGPVDGVYGSVTRAAVKRFQSDNGIIDDGVVGPQTWGTLQAAVCATGGSGAATTTIRIRVTGCEGCTVAAQRALSSDSTVKPSSPTYWDGKGSKVRGGVVTLRVPTRVTPGMSFTLTAPWQGNTGFVSNVVLGAGQGAGVSVSQSQALGTRAATACWAGTTRSTASMSFSVARVIVDGMMGKALAPLAWASPTVATVGGLGRTFSGGILGNQEAYYC